MEVIEDYMKTKEYSPNTIYNYKNAIKKYLTLYTKKDLLKSQESILKDLEKWSDNMYLKSQMLKAIIIFRKASSTKKKALLNDILSTEISSNHKNIVSHLEEKKKNDNDELPLYTEIEEKVNKYYDDGKYREYIIMKIMTETVCRNLDLNAEIINADDKQDDDKNYLVIHKKLGKQKPSIEFIRNKYKTKKSYGQKKDVFVGERMIDAVNKIGDKNLIPEKYQNNIGRYIKKISFGLGEGKIAKIVLKNKNTLGDASAISKSRGTALGTLQQSYNIVENPKNVIDD